MGSLSEAVLLGKRSQIKPDAKISEWEATVALDQRGIPAKDGVEDLGATMRSLVTDESWRVWARAESELVDTAQWKRIMKQTGGKLDYIQQYLVQAGMWPEGPAPPSEM